MKRILMLGGSTQQVIAIDTAKRLGYYTILCDYLPDNPGQYHADKFYLVSTIDKEAVLKVAIDEKIDGIIGYASEPAAPTAAYVAEKLGLPGNPPEAVETLCNKDRFRTFLREHGLNAPNNGSCSALKEAEELRDRLTLPVIVKPVDSSGSKGSAVLHSWDDLADAVEYAMSFSRAHRVIVEEFIEKKHPYLIGGDIFVVNGKIVLWGLLNCHRDNNANPLVPVGKSYPLCLEDEDIRRVKDTLQRMVDGLGICNCAMNVELVIDSGNRVWPLDVAPRGGGNMIPDLLGMIYGIDLVELTVRAAMGENVELTAGEGRPFFSTYNLHSRENGVFKEILFSPEMKPHILKTVIYKNEGDPVEFFANATKALGIVFLHFDNAKQMLGAMDHADDWIQVKLK